MKASNTPRALATTMLLVIISCALTYTVQGAFNLDEAFHANILLTAALCAILQALLAAGQAKPKLSIPSMVLCGIFCLVLCGASVLLSAASNPIADIPQNTFAGIVALCVVNIVVNALSRGHARSVVLFAAGAFTCGFVQFLYTTNMLVATIVFILAALALVGLRAHNDQTASDHQAHGLAAKNAIAVFGLPVVACLMACIVVLGVIMPLNPPHATVKIFTIYLAYQEQAVKTGVTLDEDAKHTATSSSIDASLDARTTTDKKIDANAQQTVESTADASGNANDYLSSDYSDVDISGGLEGLTSLALNPSIPWGLIIALLLLLAVLLLTLPRYITHRMRLKRIMDCSPSKQVQQLYAFFLRSFKKLGFGKPAELSPVEYANLYRHRLYPYVGAQGACTFDHLTALFVWSEFGGKQPSKQDLECMYALYNKFYENCRKELGVFKYAFRYITL